MSQLKGRRLPRGLLANAYWKIGIIQKAQTASVNGSSASLPTQKLPRMSDSSSQRKYLNHVHIGRPPLPFAEKPGSHRA
jgi:hypothetical protein